MMLRSFHIGLLVMTSALLAGCSENKASQCEKLALTLTGAAKKEMPASTGLGDKSGGSGSEISRAFKRSSLAVERELDDWQLKRPDKATSDKGAITIKAYANAVGAFEAKDPTLKANVKAYTDAVLGVWEFSKERVDGDMRAKGLETIKKVEAEEQKLTAWCAN